jgi:ADP-ribose pyrophosphatase YjhB (NUDIX family)
LISSKGKGQVAQERFKLIPVVYLILKKENRILLSLRKNTGYADGQYGLVSGHLDGGEPATEGLRREVREEIGIDIPTDALTMKLVMHGLDPDRESIDLFFLAETWDGEIVNAEPEKCGGLDFFPLDALPKNTVPYIRDALEAVFSGKVYLEHGWE